MIIDNKKDWDRLATLFFRLEKMDLESAAGLAAVARSKGWTAASAGQGTGMGFGMFADATPAMLEYGARLLELLEEMPKLQLQPLGTEVHRKRDCLRLNIPARIVDGTDFHEWLNKAAGEDDSVANAATWHRPGPIGEYSDVFVHVCDKDGSNSDMPEDWWDAILSHTGMFYEGLVWISFEE